jgi:hypothetical protein
VCAVVEFAFTACCVEGGELVVVDAERTVWCEGLVKETWRLARGTTRR